MVEHDDMTWATFGQSLTRYDLVAASVAGRVTGRIWLPLADSVCRFFRTHASFGGCCWLVYTCLPPCPLPPPHTAYPHTFSRCADRGANRHRCRTWHTLRIATLNIYRASVYPRFTAPCFTTRVPTMFACSTGPGDMTTRTARPTASAHVILSHTTKGVVNTGAKVLCSSRAARLLSRVPFSPAVGRAADTSSTVCSAAHHS